jgi:plasmid stabilization system protein ParE
VARVVYPARAFPELDRIIDFSLEETPEVKEAIVARIGEAVSMLEHHPLIGRPVEAGLRELIISRRRTGYVALYRFLEKADVVLVLALRHQREAGESP